MHPRHFLFLILLCASSGLCFGQSGAQVLQSTLQKMGGKERWQALRSLELRYNEEIQRSFTIFGEDSINNVSKRELKYYNYLNFYAFVNKNRDNKITSYWLKTQDSTFIYAANAVGMEKNQFIANKNKFKMDTVLFHIQNIEFLPRLILDCLQGKVAYEYEGLKNVEGKEYHSFWLSYPSYAKALHLLISKDYLPYQYNHYEARGKRPTITITFTEYQALNGLFLPKHLQKSTYREQEILGYDTQSTTNLIIKVQDIKLNQAPPAEVLKILKR